MASVWSDIDPTLRATVTKDSDARLQKEIHTALPDVDLARIKALSRDELIYNVCLIRRQLGIVNAAQTVVPDKSEFAHLFLKFPTATKLAPTPTGTPVGTLTRPDAPQPPQPPTPSSADPLAQILLQLQQQQQQQMLAFIAQQEKTRRDELAAAEKARRDELAAAELRFERQEQSRKEQAEASERTRREEVAAEVERMRKAEQERLERLERMHKEQLEHQETVRQALMKEQERARLEELETAQKRFEVLANKQADLVASFETTRRADVNAITARENARGMRLKRAHEILKSCVRPMPSVNADLPLWFREMQTQFDVNEVGEDIKCAALGPFLTNKARMLIAKLPAERIDTYEKMRDALLAEHKLTPQCHYRNWLSARRAKDETNVQFCTRLTVLFGYYVKARNVKENDYNALFDLMVADKLKSTFDADAFEYCRLKEDVETFPSQKIAEMADFYLNENDYSGGNENKNKGGKFQKKFENRKQNNGDKSTNPNPFGFNKSTDKDHGKNFQSQSSKRNEFSAKAKNANFNSNWRDKTLGAKENGNQFSHFNSSKNGATGSSARACYVCNSKDHLANFHRTSVSRTNRVQVEVPESLDQIDPNAQASSRPDPSDREPRDEGLNELFAESNNQVNVKRVDVMQFETNILDRQKIDAETKSLLVKLHANNKQITGLVDSGAQMTVMARRHLPNDFDFTESGQVRVCLLRGPFGESVQAKLINLPCRLVAESDDKFDGLQNVLITVAVTDELKGNDMLISLSDYKALLEHRSSFVPHATVVNHSPLLIDNDAPVVNVETIVHNKDIDLRVDDLHTNEKCDLNHSKQYLEYSSYNVTQTITDANTANDTVADVSKSRIELIEAQKSDTTLDKIRTDCAKPNSQYFIRDEILYRKTKINELPVEQLIVPVDRRVEIIEKAHDCIFGGHFASRKTLQKINQVFYWPGMKKQVKLYVESCLECQRRRRVKTNDRVPIEAIERPETAFEHMHMDVIGEIVPNSSKGHKYVLRVIDVYSRWAECFPLKTLGAKEVCDKLMELFMRTGIPLTLANDNATNMASGLNKELYSRLGIELRVTTPWHAKGNGIVERFNATIKEMIHHVLISDKPKTWSEKLPYMLWAYREVPHSTVGLSPYQLVYGKVARGPLSVMRDTWVGDLEQRPSLSRTANEYLETLKVNLRIASDIAKRYAEKTQSVYVDNHNKHSRPKSFDVGDTVLILMPDSTNKLLSRWIGPATIVLKVSDNSYNVLCDNGAVRTLHADKLRPFNNRVANVGVIFDDPDEREFGDIITCINDADNNIHNSDDVDDRKRFDAIDLSHLSTDKQTQLRKLLYRHRKVFNNKPGFCNVLRHQIKLEDGFKAKAFKPYRIPEKIKIEVDKQIDQLLADGKIRASNSPFAHPIVCVAKKDSPDIRLCVDYKYINSGTISDSFPMPRIDETLHKIAACDFITVFDASAGYHQIALEEEDIYKTAFVTHRGLYEWLVLPFGLKCSGNTFVRAVDTILKPHNQYADAYVDDNTVYTTGAWLKHLLHIDCVLTAFGEAGMTMKLSKCDFCKPKVTFLGHVVGSGEISVVESKIEAIQRIPEPSNEKQLRSFLGMCSFFRSHIPSTVKPPACLQK